MTAAVVKSSTRIVIQDLPEDDLLSQEEMDLLFGAGKIRLGVESLEQRDLMAAQLTATFAQGVLRVEGTDMRDRIVVQQANGNLKVDGVNINYVNADSPGVTSVALSEVKRLELAGLGGDDFLAVLGVASESFTQGLAIFGGAGSDAVAAPKGSKLDGDASDHMIDALQYASSPLMQARMDLLYQGRDQLGYVGHFDMDKHKVIADGEATLLTAVAAAAIAAGDYHEDAWDSAQADTMLKDLLGVLLNKSWGNKDGLGRVHPIRHPEYFDYDAQGHVLRQMPLSKDAFGAVLAAAHYSYNNPHTSQEVKQLARSLMTKWSEYLVLNQWRLHSTFIPGEFDTKKDSEGKARSTTLFGEGGARPDGTGKMALGPEGFLLLPHEIYALKNVCADMGIPTTQWDVWGSALPAALKQSLVDYVAPYLGAAVEAATNKLLQGLEYRRSLDVSVNLGGRTVPVLQGEFSISIPQSVREKISKEFGNVVRDAVREIARLRIMSDHQQLDP
ncbi:MAG: hypothetical protein U0744_08085 [Gemmataceae bacterium]